MNRFIRLILILLICISLYDIKIRFDQYLTHASAFLQGLSIGFSSKDLSHINRFSLQTCLYPINDSTLEEKQLNSIAFNMLIMEGRMLNPKKIVEKMGEAYPSNIDSKKLFKAIQYWKKLFDANPDVKRIFHKLKNNLVDASEKYPFFQNIIINLYVDTGKQKGLFENNIVKVLDSTPWWESQYNFCGIKYLVKNKQLRKHSLSGLSKEGGISFLHSAKNILNYKQFNDDNQLEIAWLTLKYKNLFNIITISIPLIPFAISILPGFLVAVIGLFLLFFISMRSRLKNKKPKNKSKSNVSETNYGKDVSETDEGKETLSIQTDKKEQMQQEQQPSPKVENEQINDSKKFLFQTS